MKPIGRNVKWFSSILNGYKLVPPNFQNIHFNYIEKTNNIKTNISYLLNTIYFYSYIKYEYC